MRHVQFSILCAALLALSATAVQAQSGSRGGGVPDSGSRGYAPAYSGGGYAQPTYSGGHAQPSYGGGYAQPSYGGGYAQPNYGGGYYGGSSCGGHFGGYAPAAYGGAQFSGCGGQSQVLYAPAGGCGSACGMPTSGAYGGAPAGVGPNPAYTPSGMSPHTSEYPTQPTGTLQPLPPNYYAPPVPLPGEPTAQRARSRTVAASPVQTVTFTERRIAEPLPALTRPRVLAD